MKKSRLAVLLVALLALLVLLLVRCGSSTDEPQATADLSLIGVACDAPGEIAEAKGASFVCVAARADGDDGEESAIFYPIAAPREERCDTPGETRKAEGIFEVCSGGKDVKKRKWVMTSPVPLAVTAFIDVGDSTDPGALEDAGVAIPEAIANLPGMQEFATAESTTTTQAPTLTTFATTTVPPETTTAPESTVAVSETTVPESTVAVSETTAPETTVAVSETTALLSPSTTVTETPIEQPALSCAEGGPCAPGDVGPAGGIVLLADYMLSDPPSLIEVAPTTWYGDAARAKSFASNLSYGGYDDWVVPNLSQLLTMRRERARFACAAGSRCTNGFANSTYWAGKNSNATNTVSFAGSGDPELADATTRHYVRPVRLLLGVVAAQPELTITEPDPS
jgi:hypothetical protein